MKKHLPEKIVGGAFLLTYYIRRLYKIRLCLIFSLIATTKAENRGNAYPESQLPVAGIFE